MWKLLPSKKLLPSQIAVRGAVEALHGDSSSWYQTRELHVPGSTGLQPMSGWWFGTVFIFPYIGNVIIPTGEVIFFRGVGQPPTRCTIDVFDVEWDGDASHFVFVMTHNRHNMCEENASDPNRGHTTEAVCVVNNIASSCWGLLNRLNPHQKRCWWLNKGTTMMRSSTRKHGGQMLVFTPRQRD